MPRFQTYLDDHKNSPELKRWAFCDHSDNACILFWDTMYISYCSSRFMEFPPTAFSFFYVDFKIYPLICNFSFSVEYIACFSKPEQKNSSRSTFRFESEIQPTIQEKRLFINVLLKERPGISSDTWKVHKYCRLKMRIQFSSPNDMIEGTKYIK